MSRNRKHTRRRPKANPRGVLTVSAGGFGFVQTAEGEYFIPASASPAPSTAIWWKSRLCGPGHRRGGESRMTTGI